MKLKNILFIAIAILTIGLFVACNDDVVVASKDNNTNFAQVLESNGAFEYGGTKYETLQDAIEAIDKAKGDALKTIKVLRDVNSDGATVPASSGITLDLNGKKLSFLTSTGVTTNGVFNVEGEGEVTFAEGVTNGTAFVVNEDGKLTVTDTIINVADQNAVKAAGEGATVTFGADAAVAGNIVASDSAAVTLENGSDVSGSKTVSSSATLNINSAVVDKVTGPITLSGGNAVIKSGLALTDDAPIAMQGSSQLSVNTGAAAYISEFDSTCTTCTIYCSVSDAASITAAEGVEIPTSSFVFGFCYVASGNEKVYFTSLADAVAFAKDGGTVTYVRDHSETGASALTYTIAETVTVNMGSFKENSNLIIASGETLTLQGGTLNGTVNGPGALESTNATFNAALGGTTALAALTDGTAGVAGTGSVFNAPIKATGKVILRYSTLNPPASNTEDDHDDDFVYSEDDITMNGVEFNHNHNVYAGVWAAKGGIVSMTNSTGTAYKIIATNTGSSSTLGTITIDNSTMTTDSFTVKDEVAARVGESPNEYFGDVFVSGYDEKELSIAKIEANDITISKATLTLEANAKTSKDSTDYGDVNSQNSLFEGTVWLTGNLVDGTATTSNDTTVYANGSTFKDSITGFGSGTLTFYASEFNNSTTAPVIIAKNDVSIYNGRTKAGNITISGGSEDDAKVLINNSTATAAFEVGTISNSYTITEPAGTHDGDVEVKGAKVVGDTTTYYRVKIAAISNADVVDLTLAEVTGAIGTSTSDRVGAVTTKESILNGAIYAESVTDGSSESYGKSEFKGAINAKGALTFYGSKFNGTTAPTIDSTDAGNIALYDCTGEAGAITASMANSTNESTPVAAIPGTITINNSHLTVAADDLTTGALTSKGTATYNNTQVNPPSTDYYNDVTLTGSSTEGVDLTVASIEANDITVSYATINEATEAKDSSAESTDSGVITSDNSTFKGNVTGAKLTDGNSSSTSKTGSTFNGNVTITASDSDGDGSATFYKSTFDSKDVSGGKNVSAKTLSITSSTFTNTSGVETPTAYTNLYALTASGENPDANTSALKITTSTGSVASLTANGGGSINVANGDASAALTVTGNVTAYKTVGLTTTYYDVTLVGNANTTNPETVKNVVVNGTIFGKDISLTQTTVNNDVYAHSGSVNATSSTFNAGNETDYTLYADGQVSISNSSFGENGDFRYNVGSKYNGGSGDGITITNSTGSMGSAICTGWSVVINNSGASDNLFITRRPTGTTETYTNAVMAGSSYNHNVVITGPNTAGKKVDITGLISGNNITMRAGTTANGTYDDTTLVVNGIGNNEFYSSASTNIYGGTYGVDESILFSGNGINIHKGTFYVGSYDACLQNVAENIHNSTDYDVKIYIDNNIVLQSPLVVGLKKGAFNLPATKSVYFLSTSSTHYIQVTQVYNSPSTYGNTNPIVFAGGRIVFNGIDVTTIQNGANSYLDYTQHKIWYKNNGVNIIGITISSTDDREFSLNSDIPDDFWGY